jgi:hypothetical protein
LLPARIIRLEMGTRLDGPGPGMEDAGCLKAAGCLVVALAASGWIFVAFSSDPTADGFLEFGLILVGVPSALFAAAVAKSKRSRRLLWLLGVFLSLVVVSLASFAVSVLLSLATAVAGEHVGLLVVIVVVSMVSLAVYALIGALIGGT